MAKSLIDANIPALPLRSEVFSIIFMYSGAKTPNENVKSELSQSICASDLSVTVIYNTRRLGAPYADLLSMLAAPPLEPAVQAGRWIPRINATKSASLR